MLLLLIQIGLILALSRAMGVLFARLRQPQVMGEMIAGIMLGPSLFGLVAHHAWGEVFPQDSIPLLNTLSQVGVIFFLFLIGLELDPKLLRTAGYAPVAISLASILAPFVLGASLSFFLYSRVFHGGHEPSLTSFALFMGASMSITAFPVLARILTERNLHKTNLGAVAIACAAVDDVTAWCLLAFVVAIARASGMGNALITAGLSVVYVGVMFFVIRPFLGRLEKLYEQSGRLSQNMLAIIFLLVLASAWTTETIGIHALFGAFLMGAIMPKSSRFVKTLTEKLEDYTVVFFLPIFFAYTGLRTEIGILNTATLWLYTILIILVACMGKFGGSSVAARAVGMSWRDASAIGVLMNTRGLMELVILNVGRDLNVIPASVFAMMVLMAVVTTALTTPALHYVYPADLLEREAEKAEKASGSKKRGLTILIPVSLPTSGPRLTTIAALLCDSAKQLPNIIALHLARPVDRSALRSGLSEAQTDRAEPLDPLLAAAAERGIAAEPISFVSRDVSGDISRVARSRKADMILMGFHKPVFTQTILGGAVHRVMTGSGVDVAVFVDRGFEPGSKLLVPYLGGAHDRLALELAGHIARNTKAQLTILHVVRPNRSGADEVLHARTNVQRFFADPTQPTPIEFKQIEDNNPVDAVVEQAKGFDLIVVGVEGEWGFDSHLFGFRPERLAHECAGSLLIVRRHDRKLSELPKPDSDREGKTGDSTTPTQSAAEKPVEAATANMTQASA